MRAGVEVGGGKGRGEVLALPSIDRLPDLSQFGDEREEAGPSVVLVIFHGRVILNSNQTKAWQATETMPKVVRQIYAGLL